MVLVEGVVECILFWVWAGWGKSADIQEANSKVVGGMVECGVSPMDVVMGLGRAVLNGATCRSSGRGRSRVPLTSAVASHLPR